MCYLPKTQDFSGFEADLGAFGSAVVRVDGRSVAKAEGHLEAAGVFRPDPASGQLQAD